MGFDTAWLGEQVKKFSDEHRKYQEYAQVLEGILKPTAMKICGEAICESRAKQVPSFARKCVKYYGKIKNPSQELTDLCGARVIVHLTSQVAQLCRFVESNFRIDPENSQDTFERLAPEQFGYRSVHYIVRLDRAALARLGVLDSAMEDKLKTIGQARAEIQLRTVAQHVWADVGHDLLYKSTFDVPKVWRRESARIAAQIEIIDNLFTQIEQGMKRLETNAGSFLPGKQALEEIEKLRAVLEHAPTDLSLIRRIVRLRISIGQYEEAIKDIEAFPTKDDPQLLGEYGYALCRLHQDHHAHPDFARGRKQIDAALEKAPNDVEMLTRYAEVLVGEGEAARRAELIRRAYTIAPNNPLALCGYLMSEIGAGNVDVLSLLYPNIDQAIAICKEQIEVRVNLPYALYLLGTLYLLRDQPLNALLALSRAISLSNTGNLTPEERAAEKTLVRKERRVREEVYRRLRHLDEQCQQRHRHIHGLSWCLDLLRLSLSSPGEVHSDLQQEQRRPADAQRIRSLPGVFKKPIVIIAGGCDPDHELRIAAYTELLTQAFAGFKGTIISGGTRQGVSGIAASLVRPGVVAAVGYLPHALPHDATEDPRFDPLIRMPRESDYLHPDKPFTPAQPLQAWKDLLGCGVDPASVKLLGIDGGEIAGFEYHMAAALGARVAVLRKSGRVADDLMRFENEPGHERIFFLPEDVESIRALLEYPPPQGIFTPLQLVTLTAGVDQAYHDQVRLNDIADWQKWLADHPDRAYEFNRSNRMQAEHIIEKLRRIGKTAIQPAGREPIVTALRNQDIESLAEVEHGRWVIERTLDGWKYSLVRDNEKKLRPQLIPWSELDEKEKEKDRSAVRAIPDLLALIGYEIRDAPTQGE
jgi:ppGpp synthetase/RelA/SpoT-type nucleotidyltranferase